MARYRARHAAGSVVADGWAPLLVASRFGTLVLRRQVLAHRDGRPHCMPGNDILPAHEGLVITRGLQEMACLLCQDLPFATAARLLGWQVGEPKILSASTLRTLVRRHGARIRCLEQSEAQCLLSYGTRGQRLRDGGADCAHAAHINCAYKHGLTCRSDRERTSLLARTDHR